MSIIRKVYLWWKALRDSLTDAQFAQLCEACAENEKGAEASIIKTYLRWHVPAGDRIRHLYNNGEALSRWYLKRLCLREVTEQEQYYLVNFMRWDYSSDKWPCELSEPNILELFDTEIPRKIAMYAAKYPLPEKFEILLIRRCARERLSDRKKTNSYYQALKAYLMCGPIRQKMRSRDSQMALLALDDDKIFSRVVRLSTIDENVVHPEVITEMVVKERIRLLRLLLRETYIDSAEQRDAIAAKFLSLRQMVAISSIRREVRKVELATGEYYGAAFPTEEEADYILHSCQYDVSRVRGRLAFVNALRPLLMGKPTLHLCAWAAYHFPELENLACAKAREVASEHLGN